MTRNSGRLAIHRVPTGVYALAVAAVLSATLASQVVSPAAQGITMLQPDQTTERTLGHGQEHRYVIALKAGEYARVTVEQRGIDVVVRTRDADAALVAEVQDEITSGGHEEVHVVADAAQTYTIAIAAAPGIVVSGAYRIRVDRGRAATAVDRSREQVHRLRTAAAQRSEQEDITGAVSLLERALTAAEGVGGRDDLQTARVSVQLADILLDVRRETAKAESLYQRTLPILDRTRGAGHPDPAIVRMQLAKVYVLTGQRLKAEALAREGLEVIERTLGPEHHAYARGLVPLTLLRETVGDLEQAEAHARRALTILEKIGDANSRLYCGLLNNLGVIHLGQRDSARAEEVLRRSLTLSEKLRDGDSYLAASPLANLGAIAYLRKDYATAEAYFRRVISIMERVVGPDNPGLTVALNNLANVYSDTGDTARALDIHFRALRIREKVFGPYHRGTVVSLANIALIHAASGDSANRMAFQRRLDEIIEKQLALNLAVGSERQKLAFVDSLSHYTDWAIALSLAEGDHAQDASESAVLALLQRKGRVLDAMVDTVAAVRQRVPDPQDQQLLNRLNATNAELARVALTAPEGADPEVRRRQIEELETRKERLEGVLGEHSAEFRAQAQPVTLEAVRAAIPEDAVLLELATFRTFDPKRKPYEEAFGATHYAAYVMRKNAAPRGVDLGPARSIDEGIAALRSALRDPLRRDLSRLARAVDERVVKPLRASFGSATRLLVSPDGDLNLVPFDALIDEQGRYLVERYAITYLTSGRDLLRMQVARVSRGKPVIVANPLFGEPPPSAEPLLQTRGATDRTRQAARPLAAAPGVHRSVTIGDDLSTLYFAPLAATAVEARAIKGLFPESVLFTGAEATKTALQRVVAPRLLHIASHGFFLREPSGGVPPSSAAPSASGTRGISASANVENPLLRSGLALAGANLTHPPHDDGILTALEASGLDLWGTKLVTLSACDTGVGEIRNGEGVYGLRRAFVLAGAETLVMSLWPVSDYVTREVMTAYYRGLRAGLGRGDALRQAKLTMLARKGRQHPFFWASFIQSGEWASLNGTRETSRR